MKSLVLTVDKTLVLSESPVPTPLPGESLVSLKASALNHREIWITKGLYPGMTLPCILGADGAGVVTAVGDHSDSEWVGKGVMIYPAFDWGDSEAYSSRKFRVMGMPDPGTLSEYICVPVSNLVPKPAYLSWEEAAAVPVAGLTAWRALTRHGNIGAASKVLITGIGGGVAQAGLSLALAFGAEVYVTSSKPDKIKKAMEMGASGGANYKDPEWPVRIKDQSSGIDIILDSSPSANLDDYLKFMNFGGRIVAYGSTGSPKTTISISRFFLRHIHFIGTTMGSPEEFKALLSFMEKHKLKPLIEETYPLVDAIKAIEALEQGEHMGKIVLSHRDKAS